MSRLGLAMHVLTIIVAASYVTLGIEDSHAAAMLWAPYGLLTLVLAVVNIAIERADERRQ